MRKLKLSTLLIALNAGLLALALTGAALYAGRLLGRAFDRNAHQRVELAASIGRQSVIEVRHAVETSARLLGERPTLARLLNAGDAPGVTAFLEQFRRTSGLDGCAVFRNGVGWAYSGTFSGWTAVAARTEPRVAAATSAISGAPGATVWAVRRIGDELELEISARVGLPIRLLTAEPEGASSDSVYAAVAPIPGNADQPTLVVEATLPAGAVDAERDAALRVLAGWCAVVALIGIAASFVVARAVALPVERLRRAAARIGAGDFETTVRGESGAEIGALAGSMEGMRGHLLMLTSEIQHRRTEAEAILAGIVEGVMAVDRERRIRYLNPRAAELLGIAPEAAAGRFCGDVLRPETADGVPPCDDDCPIVRARSQGRARAVEHLAPLGGERRTVVITGAAGAEGRQILLLRDETEIEATRRLRDAVLAHISHEFKTPLAAQLASIEMLRDRLGDLSGPDAASLVLSLERGTLRLTRLIDNLLESVRIESGRLSIRRQAVDLAEVLREAGDSMAPLLEQRRQRLALDLPQPLPEVEGDTVRLVQVFVNLLANANKFAPPDSTIRVTGRVTSGAITVWVEDQGPGFPDMPDDALFRSFTRALGEEPEESGLGLGLWIAKSIVERHGGSIVPLRQDVGARMSVTLPRKDV